MAKIFTKPYPEGFQNLPEKTTPITAEVLNAIQNGIDALDDKVNNLEQSGGSSDDSLTDYALSEKEQIGMFGNRPVYEQWLSVDAISGTETVVSPDSAYYSLLAASGAADHTITDNDTETQRIAIPFAKGEEFCQIAEDRTVKANKKIILRTDSVDYSKVNIALKFLGKLQISNPCTWADGTVKEIQTLLQAHYDGDFNIYDYWSVGDERKIQMGNIYYPNNGYVTDAANENYPSMSNSLILVNRGGKTLVGSDHDGLECAFVVQFKYIPTPGIHWMWNKKVGEGGNYPFGWSIDPTRGYHNTGVYNAIPDGLRDLFKLYKNTQTENTWYGNQYGLISCSDYLAPPDEIEIAGTLNRTLDSGGKQFDYYKNGASPMKEQIYLDDREKYRAWEYSLRSQDRTQADQYKLRVVVNKSGSVEYGNISNWNYGSCPIGVI